MSWFDTAISIEIEGENFYRDLAQNAAGEGMRQIFTMLADDELKHKAVFEAMKDSKSAEYEASASPEEVKQVFGSFTKQDFLNEQQHAKLYRKARNVEKQSVEFYTAQLNDLTDKKQKDALEKIIKEEESHFRLIDSIMVLVERPESWVEDAEFGLREEY